MKNRHINLIGAILIGLCVFYTMPHNVMVTGRNDFAHFYIGGLLYGTPAIHSIEANQQKQIELTGVIMANSYFIRPTFYGFLLKPLSWLPYYRAYLVFQAIGLGCLIFFLWTFARGRQDLLILAAMTPPLIANFVLGQDVMLLVGILTGTILLARCGRDFTAGLILTLCAIKFHLFLFVPAAVLFHRRFRILWGGLAGGVILFVMGLGSGGFVVYPMLLDLLRNPLNSPIPAIMPNLRGFVYALAGSNTALLITLSVIVAAIVLFLAWRVENFEHAMAYCLIGGVLVNFHAYMQDCLLFLVAFALLPKTAQLKTSVAFLTIAILPFPYIALYAGPPYSALFDLLPLLTLATATTAAFLKRPVVSLSEASETASLSAER